MTISTWSSYTVGKTRHRSSDLLFAHSLHKIHQIILGNILHVLIYSLEHKLQWVRACFYLSSQHLQREAQCCWLPNVSLWNKYPYVVGRGAFTREDSSGLFQTWVNDFTILGQTNFRFFYQGENWARVLINSVGGEERREQGGGMKEGEGRFCIHCSEGYLNYKAFHVKTKSIQYREAYRHLTDNILTFPLQSLTALRKLSLLLEASLLSDGQSVLLPRGPWPLRIRKQNSAILPTFLICRPSLALRHMWA